MLLFQVSQVPGGHYSLVEAVSNRVQSARYDEQIGHCLEGSTLSEEQHCLKVVPSRHTMGVSRYPAASPSSMQPVTKILASSQNRASGASGVLRYWLPARTELAKVELLFCVHSDKHFARRLEYCSVWCAADSGTQSSCVIVEDCIFMQYRTPIMHKYAMWRLQLYQRYKRNEGFCILFVFLCKFIWRCLKKCLSLQC